jgi:hypothetical protein
MAICQPTELLGTASEASGYRNRPILLLAAPGCGAEKFLRSLAQLKNFSVVRDAHFPIKAAANILSHVDKPPPPGLHFLTDYHSLLKAVRRLMDSIIDLRTAVTDSGTCLRIIYSPDNIFHISTLRLLYPDALHLHFVRDVSSVPLRMATETQLSIWRLCERWRESERVFLDAPPWPSQVTICYEELELASVDTVGFLMKAAGLPFTADDQNTFAKQFYAASKEKYFRGRSLSTLSNDPGPCALRRIADRMAGRYAAVYCQAELAALKYKTSTGHPGSLRTFVAVTILRSIPRAGINFRRPGTGRVYS